MLIKDFDAYFDYYQDTVVVDFGTFSSFFFQVLHPFLDEKSQEEYKNINNE